MFWNIYGVRWTEKHLFLTKQMNVWCRISLHILIKLAVVIIRNFTVISIDIQRHYEYSFPVYQSF